MGARGFQSTSPRPFKRRRGENKIARVKEFTELQSVGNYPRGGKEKENNTGYNCVSIPEK